MHCSDKPQRSDVLIPDQRSGIMEAVIFFFTMKALKGNLIYKNVSSSRIELT